MWYADLSPFVILREASPPCLRAVGWLERDRPFPTGPVERAVYERLGELLRDPWEPHHLTGFVLGYHHCDLCLYEGPGGKRHLYLPGDDALYVCPELITHYMNAHGYRPPDEFCAAVLACPPMRSVPYFKALLAAGGRALVQQARDA